MKFTIVAVLLITGCQTAQQAREIQLLSFSEDVSKGKSVGPMEGDDCIWQILGYQIGGYPTLQKAIINARKGKGSTIGDHFGGEATGSSKSDVRYFNNVTVTHGGFNAYVVGKSCITITATGYN